jgi:pimeloyl-ACP methyl ester carboxylesterase
MVTSKSICFEPKSISDPSISIIPAGKFSYHTKASIYMDGKDVNVSVEGVAYYPVDSDPKLTLDPPFSASIPKSPIVFVANGASFATHYNPSDRCDLLSSIKGYTGTYLPLLCELWAPRGMIISPPPGWAAINSYRGFEYFQEKLAKLGFIAVSVNLDRIDELGIGYGLSLIEAKASLIGATIEYFQKLNSDLTSVLYEHIDFELTGLMGHSQGGEAAIVAAQESKGWPDVVIKAVLAVAPTDIYWSEMLNTDAGTDREDEMWKSLTISQFAFMVILPAADGDVFHCAGAKYYDRAIPKPCKIQLYVHGANHNYFNSRWLIDDSLGVIAPLPNGMRLWEQDPSSGKIKIYFDSSRRLPLSLDLKRVDHEQILSVYGCAFFRDILRGEPDMNLILFHRRRPDGVKFDNVHFSFQHMNSLTVDNHEDQNGIERNSLNPPQPTSQSHGLKAKEYLFAQPPLPWARGTYPEIVTYTFFGFTIGMITDYIGRNGIFRSQLTGGLIQNLTGKDVYIRVAEVAMADPPDDKLIGFKKEKRSGFELGLQDKKGVTWVHSDAVGGLPRPYYRGHGNAQDPFTVTKTMLATMRFPLECFKRVNPHLDTKNIVSILLRTNLRDIRPLAFDDLQIL